MHLDVPRVEVVCQLYHLPLCAAVFQVTDDQHHPDPASAGIDDREARREGRRAIRRRHILEHMQGRHRPRLTLRRIGSCTGVWIRETKDAVPRSDGLRHFVSACRTAGGSRKVGVATWVVEQLPQRLRERARLAAAHEVAVDALADEIAQIADVGDDGRQPAGHGFHQRECQPLGFGRQHEDPRAAQPLFDALLLAGEGDAI